MELEWLAKSLVALEPVAESLAEWLAGAAVWSVWGLHWELLASLPSFLDGIYNLDAREDVINVTFQPLQQMVASRLTSTVSILFRAACLFLHCAFQVAPCKFSCVVFGSKP